MKLGEDYVLAVEGENDWSVILEHDPWENVVVKYHNIQILDKGTKLSFQHELMFNPNEVDTDCLEYEDHIAEVLDSVIRHFHEQGGMQYFSKETGEEIDV